ncbi:hypothetical protein [Streptosporangium roseum]|uniref:hypothetical protein n=1 Tax=Streptosporangium roseum TaxID=2001 RepID=UPI00332DBB39
MNITKHLNRPFAAALIVAAILSVAAACPATPKACAATAVVSLDTPPEPITDGSYRDGSYEEGGDDSEVAPEPITDGSYRDGSYTEEEDQQDEEPKKKTRKNKADDDQDDAGSC